MKDKQVSYNLRKPFDLIDSLNKKAPSKIEGVAIGDVGLDYFVDCARSRYIAHRHTSVCLSLVLKPIFMGSNPCCYHYQ